MIFVGLGVFLRLEVVFGIYLEVLSLVGVKFNMVCWVELSKVCLKFIRKLVYFSEY